MQRQVMLMEVTVLFSGGKDSTYALYKAMREHDVKCLLTMIPERSDSWMFHYPLVYLTRLQAEAIVLKHVEKKTCGEKEKELEDLKNALKEVGVEGVVSGAIASEYQKKRIDRICAELGLKGIAPLWQRDSEELLREEIRNGFEIIISGVYAEGFDKSWIGRKIDEECVDDLVKLNKRFGINISGEGGEFESFVIDGPIFKKRVQIVKSSTVWDSKTGSGYIVADYAKLVDKILNGF
jgi:ABC transporter with metal-binding/Fe-S-binding domain ATP-binding protein